MGELCLRWAMKVPADVPIVWPDNATFSMHQIRAALLSLDDGTDLPRISVSFLAVRTGLAPSTVRTTLKRMEKAGQLPFGRGIEKADAGTATLPAPATRESSMGRSSSNERDMKPQSP